jgi:NADPH-dependent glutamate synthase beta subunit-like oxidoreductase
LSPIDNIDPGVFRPERTEASNGKKVAVVGAGPAGLTAAHCLSLQGYAVTVLDAGSEPGGMLTLGIPSFRLPRDVLRKEIAGLLDDNITLEMNTELGKDFSVDQLFDNGFQAVFLALGSLRSRRLNVDGEDAGNVYSSMEFLREFNSNGRSLARGHVGVIGGGNSAVDAARIALRQEEVDKVTILYRRTREEMPAFAEEIDAAVAEGVRLETLLSPVEVHSAHGKVKGVEFIRNELGDRDDSGRRRPVAVPGTEHMIRVDTLIVAIGETPDTGNLGESKSAGIETANWGAIKVEPHTMATGRPGVFAGGDVVTGPNTVVDAIAAGKKVALMIDRYLKGEVLRQPAQPSRPKTFVAPVSGDPSGVLVARPSVPHVAVPDRTNNFVEVEKVFEAEAARAEAAHCLRCDLEFTQSTSEDVLLKHSSGGRA